MPYMLLMMVALVISWAMMLNIAKLLTDRMIMQNAADNAAMSVAIYQARVLNLVGRLNYYIGCTLGAGVYPYVVQMNEFDQHMVGCLTDGLDNGPELNAARYAGANGMRVWTRLASNFEFALVDGYRLATYSILSGIANKQDFKDNNIKVIWPLPMSCSIDGLQRNDNQVTYYKTVNWSIPAPCGLIHVVTPKEYCTENYSWYYIANEGKFANRKITAILSKDNEDGYPILGKWLGISWPSIEVTASASVYNRAGPMFPRTKSNATGVPKALLPVFAANCAFQLNRLNNIRNNAALLPGPIPAMVATFAIGGYSEEATRHLTTALNDKETPIRADQDAENGGWDAHLVPAKYGVQH